MTSAGWWVGELKPGWRLRRLKDVATLTNGYPFESERFSDATGIRLVRIRDLLQPDSEIFYNGPIPPSARISDGDLLVGMDGDFNAVIWSGGDAVLNQRLCRLRVKNDYLDPRFLSYVIPLPLQHINELTYATTVKHLSSIDLLNVQLPLPSLSDQETIADFLDAETARIDSLIAKKRSLQRAMRTRLEIEARTLMSSDSPSLPLRRAAAAIKTGSTPPAREIDRLAGSEVPWLSPGDLGASLSIRSAARTLSAAAITEGWCPAFPANSTVVVGIGATAGRVGHLDEPASGNQQITCIVAGPKLHARFLSWHLWTREQELRATAPYTTLPIINNEYMRDFRLALPSLREQAKVVTRLDELAVQSAQVGHKLERQIALLQEHRQAVITAAVTGELEIPSAA